MCCREYFRITAFNARCRDGSICAVQCTQFIVCILGAVSLTIRNVRNATSCCMARIGPRPTMYIRVTKEANSVCSMYEHDHESFHHNFQVVLPSLIVLLSKVGPATATIRSVHELSLSGETTPCDWSNPSMVKPCVACVKLEHGFKSRIALRALRKILRNTLALRRPTLRTLRS